MPTILPIKRVGDYVSPQEGNTLISHPDTVVIDVGNDYETRIGKFKGAINPCSTISGNSHLGLRMNPEADAKHLKEQDNDIHTNADDVHKVAKRGMPRWVAMYCTGGIRCEKASKYLLSKGFKEVYHLRGGILKYLEEVPRAESLCKSDCFVFDKRVSIEHGLVQGSFRLCYGCKQPVSDADMEAPEWEYGVSCPYGHSSKSEEEKDRARRTWKLEQGKRCWGTVQ